MNRAKPITLSHIDHGPMRVTVWDEASLWEGQRIWTCDDDPELGAFTDDDFDEHYGPDGERIDDILARAPDGNRSTTP
jgi:hypothetical protein